MSLQTCIYDTDALAACDYQLEGYTFEGWSLDAAGSSVISGTAPANLTVEEDSCVTVYAQWKANEYRILFNGNGSDPGMMEAQTCAYDQEAELPECAFSRTNYHFTGWNTRADGTGEQYDEGESIKNLTAQADGTVNLWAQWEHDAYTVCFDASGGEGYMPDEEIWTGIQVELPVNVFARDGYTFAGWNTQADGSGTLYEDHASIKDLADPGDTIVLYAQWQPDEDNATDPIDPVDPAETTEPTDPAGPIEQTEPVDSVDPTDPVDPIFSDQAADKASDEESQTGDGFSIGMYMLLTLAALAVAGAVFGRRRAE